MFDYTQVIESKDLAKKLESVAYHYAKDARAHGLPIEAEDVASHLYEIVHRRPSLQSMYLSKATGILKQEAHKYVNAQRNERNGFTYSEDELVKALTAWGRGEALPKMVHDAVYGEYFQSTSSFYESISDVFRFGKTFANHKSAEYKTFSRAMLRLCEIVSGVMVGPNGARTSLEEAVEETYFTGIRDTTSVDPLEAIRQKYAVVELEEVLGEDGGSFTGKYQCSRGHVKPLETAVESPKRLGRADVYGYRNCSCGEVLKLAK